MKTRFAFRSTLAFSCVLASISPVGNACAAPVSHSSTSSKEKPAVLRALKSEFNRQTSGHVRVAAYSVTKLDVDSGYALAKVNPTRPAGLDPVSVLMHKQGRQWKFVTLGTALNGSGKQYGIPHKLWSKWGL